jgi:hypothetical protein
MKKEPLSMVFLNFMRLASFKFLDSKGGQIYFCSFFGLPLPRISILLPSFSSRG